MPRSRRSPLGLMLALAAAGAGCSEEPPPSVEDVGAEVVEPLPRDLGDDEALYDDEGVPLESDERVAGLVLPRGLTEIEELRRERRRAYTSVVPPDRLLRYFGPRLTTVHIDRHGATVVYRDAIPRGVRGGVVKLDVTIAPSRVHAARVEIHEVPPLPPEGTKISPDEIRRHLDRRNQRRE